jgi:hypothetical protein
VLIPLSLNVGFALIPSQYADTSRHLSSLSRLGYYLNAGDNTTSRRTSICPVGDRRVNFTGTLRLGTI